MKAMGVRLDLCLIGRTEPLSILCSEAVKFPSQIRFQQTHPQILLTDP